jgi:hypothetical protein
VIAGSIALLGFGLHSGVEAMANLVIWQFLPAPGWSAPLPSGAPSS